MSDGNHSLDLLQQQAETDSVRVILRRQASRWMAFLTSKELDLAAVPYRY